MSAQAELLRHDVYDLPPEDRSELAHRGVDSLEAVILAKLPPVDLESATVHHFAPGIYARELRIPAGTLLTGKIHRTRHLNIVSKGRITVWSDREGTRTVEAPHAFVAEPGTRRVGFAHEDTVWTTVHSNPEDERDLRVLEGRLIEPRAPALTAHDLLEQLVAGGDA